MAGAHRMCSLLVFNLPNIHPDPTQQWTKFTTGDVIEVQDDDNFQWGAAVQGPKALGWWHVVQIPGVPAAQLVALAMGASPPIPPAPYLLRTQTINVQGLLAAAQSANVTPTTLPKSATVPDVVLDQVTLLAQVSAKPPLVNQTVIGGAGQPPVIG